MKDGNDEDEDESDYIGSTTFYCLVPYSRFFDNVLRSHTPHLILSTNGFMFNGFPQNLSYELWEPSIFYDFPSYIKAKKVIRVKKT